MQALHWDGHELRFEPHYSIPRSMIDDRGPKIVGATGGRPLADAKSNALVKVHLAGVCSTDLQILKGYMGFTACPVTSLSVRLLKVRENGSASGWSVKSISVAAIATTAGAIWRATVRIAA